GGGGGRGGGDARDRGAASGIVPSEEEALMDLDSRRRFYAEELEAICNLRTPGLVDALAVVPRERFLPPGPWTVLEAADGFMMGAPPRSRTTPDADPARVYHNIAIAIDPARQLFNGQPGTLVAWLDVLNRRRGGGGLHLGGGLGYYSAARARAVGPTGRVVAIDVDEPLASAARANLASMPWVDVRHADGASITLDETFDALLI